MRLSNNSLASIPFISHRFHWLKSHFVFLRFVFLFFRICFFTNSAYFEIIPAILFTLLPWLNFLVLLSEEGGRCLIAI